MSGMSEVDPVGTVERKVVEVTQLVYWNIDVTDWLEDGRDYTEAELEELAKQKWEYHEYGQGEECDCTGWGWGLL